jgi:hypothetical protein
MWRTACLVVMVLSLVAFRAERPAAQTPASESSVSSPDAGSISRVRSTDVRITALMGRAVEQSATFRSLLDTIAATDGIVYVEAGRCGRLRACLTVKVTVAGPNRILWIVVDPRRAACDVMASIGHELWACSGGVTRAIHQERRGPVFPPRQGPRAESALARGNAGRGKGGTRRARRAS